MNEPTEPVDPPAPEPGDNPDHSLKGTFVSVMLMGVFFVAVWFGVFAIAMERR